MPVSLIIFIAVVMLIAFLCISRIKVCVNYIDKFNFSVKYLFFTYRMKNEKVGQAKHEKKPAGKISLEQLRTFLELYERFSEETKKLIIKVKNKACIDKIKLALTVGGGDAADTAITYGEACAVIFPAVSALGNLVKIKRNQIKITPQFNGESSIVFEAVLSIRLGTAISVGFVSIAKILISLVKDPIDFAKIRQRGVVK